MNTQMIITTLVLQIGLAVEEVFNYFRGDFKTMFRDMPDDPISVLTADRVQWLGKWCSPSTGIDAEVEAVILDRHESFDWEKWLAEGGPEKTVKTDFRHAEALACIAEQRALPGTLWPLLCFGYQYREYFCELKHNPKWLIAPGTLARWTDHCHHFAYRIIGDEKPAEILRMLIQYYDPGRVLGLQLFGGDEQDLPLNLTVGKADDFVQTHKIDGEVYMVTVGSPPAVCTEHRAAFMYGYSEPTYPRVLGIRSR